MPRHGRAVIPFGTKYKGVQIRVVPSDYLSWLATTEFIHKPQWDWLKASLIAELKHRGLDVDHLVVPCERCGGVGRVESERVPLNMAGGPAWDECPVCGGSGEVPRPAPEIPRAPAPAEPAKRPTRVYRL